MALKGFVGFVSKYQMRGWAYFPEAAAEHVRVSVECDGAAVAAGVANLFREDLARDGVGSGHHGFVINLDRPLSDEDLARVEVWAIHDSGLRRRLPAAAAPKLKPATPAPSLELVFEPIDPSQRPVFILGAARSGTSALAQGLIRSGWYEGHGEGHFWPLLPRLLATASAFYAANAGDADSSRNTLLGRVREGSLLLGVRSLFAHIARQAYPSGRWLDKTPNAEMIAASPILQEIWPDAKFVFAYRRGIENIASRLRKFPNIAFSAHCEDWATVMNAWLKVREKLGANAIEIEHFELAREPKRATIAVAALLRMPEDRRVRLEQALAFDRPERTDPTFAKIHTLETVGWDENQKADFLEICGPMMSAYKYTLDETYTTDIHRLEPETRMESASPASSEAVSLEAVSLNEFDEEWYLERYPDVAESVARGGLPSGYAHFLQVGHLRGRLGVPQIDEAWYLGAYPVASREIEAGKAENCVQHYLKFGRYRGYLTDRKARRHTNAAGFQSRFGGLWTDQKNALDLVAGRRDLGMVSESDAQLLTSWIHDGYVILDKAIEEEVLQAALVDLESAYDGNLPNLKFSVSGLGQRIDWAPEAKSKPAKALDIHWFSPAIRDLIFAPKVLHFMHLVFERRALASQTLGFLRGSAQDAHQDSAYVNYTLPMQFMASWIALEDVKAGAGELFYYPGSQRMPDFVYGGQFKGAEEARRLGAVNNIERELKTHVENIPKRAESMGLKKERLLAKRGDVLFWSADLAHGSSPISTDNTRKSVVTHYCPAEIMPTYVDVRPKVVLKAHKGAAYYTTSHYAEFEPN